MDSEKAIRCDYLNSDIAYKIAIQRLERLGINLEDAERIIDEWLGLPDTAKPIEG